MNRDPAPPPPTLERTASALAAAIAPPPGTKLYGIIDGVSVPDLRRLADASPGRCGCLFAGPLPLEVEQTAPHLAELEPEGELLRRWLHEGWGNHWGIFAHVPAELSFSEVRKHFRTFLRVRLPDRRYVLFRYYDPRVLRVYLPTCTAEEARLVFGPVVAYFVEDKDPLEALRFSPESEGSELQRLALAKWDARSEGRSANIDAPDQEPPR